MAIGKMENPGGSPGLWPISLGLEPVQNSGVHPHVIFVSEAVEAERHPIQLDGTKDQLALPEVQTTTEQHRHTAIANARRRTMGTPKQSVRIW
jgi:hypothetical protein